MVQQGVVLVLLAVVAFLETVVVLSRVISRYLWVIDMPLKWNFLELIRPLRRLMRFHLEEPT